MSLRSRVGSVLAAILVLLGLSAVLIAEALTTFADQRSIIVDDLQPASADGRSLLLALVDQETGGRGFVITGDESYLAPFEEGGVRVQEISARLQRQFSDDPVISASLADVKRNIASWYATGPDQEIAARRSGGADAAEQLVRDDSGREAFTALRDSVGDLQALLAERVAAARELSDQSFNRLRWLAMSLVLLFTAAALTMAWLLRRWVLRPVDEVRRSMRMVTRGDLNAPIKATGPPEIKAIGGDAEEMRRRIVDELDNVQGALTALRQQGPAVAGLLAELTPRATITHPQATISGRSHAAEGLLAGDWWDAFTIPDGGLAAIVADVAGHGVEACLVAARFKQRLETALRGGLGLLEGFALAAGQLDDSPERFLSCIVVVLEPDVGRVRWINAGHPPGLLLNPAISMQTHSLEGTGPLVSVLNGTWRVAEAPLAAGDMLVLMTDGILEARRGDEEFGLSRVVDALGWDADPETSLADLVEAVRAFADDWHRDDVTAVAIRVESVGGNVSTVAPAGTGVSSGIHQSRVVD